MLRCGGQVGICANVGTYASLLRVGKNTSIGNTPMWAASHRAFSTFSDPLLQSANLRKIQTFWQRAIDGIFEFLVSPTFTIRSTPVSFS